MNDEKCNELRSILLWLVVMILLLSGFSLRVNSFEIKWDGLIKTINRLIL